MKGRKSASSSHISSRNRLSQTDSYISQFLDAACDSHRRVILELLIPPNGQDSPDSFELRSGEIAELLGLAPSTTSEHLHKLLKLRLVSARKEGTAVYYRLRNDHLVRAFHELLQALETHYSTSSSRAEA